jgi:ParB/RepB/Spo0J family partition protein
LATIQEYRVEDISLGGIEPPLIPLRRIDLDFIKELSQSILSKGLKTPVQVRSLSPERNRVIDGVHRIEAVKLLGLPRIKAQVYRGISDCDEMELTVTHTVRLDFLNPWAEGKLFARLKQDRYSTIKNMATSLGKSSGYLNARLRVFYYLNPALVPKIGSELSIANALALSWASPGRQLELAKSLFEKVKVKSFRDQRTSSAQMCVCPVCSRKHPKARAQGFGS